MTIEAETMLENQGKWTFSSQSKREPPPSGLDKRAITILFTIVGFIVLVTKTFEQPGVPDDLKGHMKVSGAIESCEMSSLGKGHERYYIAIRLDNKEAPLLGGNPLISERVKYSDMCHSKATVSVEYHAEKREDGDLVFWIDEILEQ